MTNASPALSDVRALVAEYLERAYAFSPAQTASILSLHTYDGLAEDRSQARLDARRLELRDFMTRIAAIDRTGLPQAERFDIDLISYHAEGEMYDLTTGNVFAEQPLAYAGFEVTSYLKRDYAPYAARVRHALTFLRGSLPLLDQARANLNPRLSRPILDVSLGVFKGYAVYYGEDGEFFSDLGTNIPGDLLQETHTVAAQVAAAISEFATWLQSRYESATDDFALGRERYAQYLKAHELVEMTPEALLAIGEADLARNNTRLQTILSEIMPGKTVADAVKEMGRNHPSAATLISETEAMLERIRTYLIDNHIITVPSEVRCTVTQTPSYYPAEAFASMDPPGPFETVATEAYYYVNGPKPDWPPEKQEEWLSTFAYPNLEDISIHEAYPGHYVQLLHMQNAPSNAARSMYNYAFVEGWAHYCEQMMIPEEGYGGGDPRLEVAQLLEALIRNVRFVCSIQMHTQGMSVARSTQRFVEEAHLAPASAEAEAMRGTYDPGYLAYTLGKLQILKLRADDKAEKSAAFNLQTFHDRLLAFGSPPIALIRRYILEHDDGVVL